MDKTSESSAVVLVTGLSGAGMSTALKGLEDLGYEAIDNLPISLVSAAMDDRPENPRPLAIGIDCRTRDFSAQKLIECAHKHNTQLLLVTCTDFVLQNRYSETRRRHPLSTDRSVVDGITKERELIAPLYDHADKVIDTTELTTHDMRRIIAGTFRTEDAYGLMTFVTSFGFRNGVPREADMVFDVRFLWNPHYDPDLKPLTGKNPKIQKRLGSEEGFKLFFEDITHMLENLIPRYKEEGKSYLTIAIGCTGGRHRSVFVAEKLYEWLDENGHSTGIKHRDLERWSIQQKERGDKITSKKRKAS